MTEDKFKSTRIIDGKPRQVIVDVSGKIINMDPTRDELHELEDQKYKRHPRKDYTDEELLDYLRQFVIKNKTIPVSQYFRNSPEFPNIATYIRHFGSWQKALKLIGLDVESVIKKGILNRNSQKGRLAEIIIREHFQKNPVDLAGDNNNSHCDGICPNGKIYDVKSSNLREGGYWHFTTMNEDKGAIEIYYCLAFNKDWTKLEHGWRVPGWNVIEKNGFYVGLVSRRFNVENMKEYEITDQLRDTLKFLKVLQ